MPEYHPYASGQKALNEWVNTTVSIILSVHKCHCWIKANIYYLPNSCTLFSFLTQSALVWCHISLKLWQKHTACMENCCGIAKDVELAKENEL